MSILRRRGGGENERTLDGDKDGMLEMKAMRRIEEVIGEAGGGYWSLIENSSALIQSVNPDGRYFYVNRAWRDTLGYSYEDVEKLTFMDVIHRDCREHCMEIFRRLLSGGSFEKIECDFVTKAGLPVRVRGDVSCFFENRLPVATRGVFRPVSGGEEAEVEVTGESVEEEYELAEIYLEFKDLVGA